MTRYWVGVTEKRSRRRSTLTGRYTRVTPTEQEREAYIGKHPGAKGPAVPRLRCLTCGAYIWGSGLGIGSHERGKEHNDAEAQRRRVEVYGPEEANR